MNNYDLIIVGAGFAGIYTAWAEAKRGRKVALVEAADAIGGNLISRPWNGYWLDNGTHNFDIRSPVGEDFYLDILGDNALIFEDQQWAATTGTRWSYGYEFPEFHIDHPALARQILEELTELSTKAEGDTPASYLDWYRQTRGDTLTEAIQPMLAKVTGSDPTDISSDAQGSLGMFRRVRIGDDQEMIALKEKGPFWDDRVAVSLAANDPRYIGQNVNKRFCYPAQKGLLGFCEAAEARLNDLGVVLLKASPVTQISDNGETVDVVAGSETITAPKLFWSLPEIGLGKILGIDIDLTKSAIPVGTAFFVFEVHADSILGPDYLHDYSTDRLPFRYNKAGVYGGQIKSDGMTYVTCEVPAHPAKLQAVTTADNAKRAWSGLIETGFLKPDTAYRDYTMWGHPVAYTLPKTGWRGDYDRMQTEIQNHSDKIVGIDFGYRGRAAFMTRYQDFIQHQL